MRSCGHLLLTAPLVLAGCARDNPLFGLTGGETAAADGGGTGGDGGSGAAETSSGAADPDEGGSTAAGASATGSSGGASSAECGNGRLETGEECDDDREFCVDCVEIGRIVWDETYSQGGPYEDRFAGVASVGNRIVAIGRTRAPQLNGVLAIFDSETGDLAEPPALLTNAADGANFNASDLFGLAVDGTTLFAAGSVDRADQGGGLRAAVLEYHALDSQPQLVEVHAGLAGNVARAVVHDGGILGVGLANWMQGAYGSAEIPTDGGPADYWLSVPAADFESAAATIFGGEILIGGMNDGFPFVATTQGSSPPAHWDLSTGTGFEGGIQGLLSLDGDILVAGFEGVELRSPWIGRYEPTGAEVWRHVLPDSGPVEEFESVVLDGAGNIIVVGYIGGPTVGLVAGFEPDGTPGVMRIYPELGEGTRFRDAVYVPERSALFVVGEVVTEDDAEDAFIMRVHWDS